MDEQNKYELEEEIDRYLLGEMEAHEILNFERRIDTDPELAKALIEQNKLNEVLASSKTWKEDKTEREETKVLVQDLISEFEFQTDKEEKEIEDYNTPFKLNRKFILYATSIAAAIIILILTVNIFKTSTFPEIWADNYNSPLNNQTLRGFEDTGLPIDRLTNYYTSGDTEKGIALLDSLISDQDSVGDFTYFKAHFLLAQQDTLSAKEALEFAKNSPTRMRERASFELALIYLHFKNWDLAERELESLVNSESTRPRYKNQSQTILKQLSDLR